MVAGCSQSIPKITLAYDNICNLARLKVAQKKPPLDMAWRNVEKIIDVFHFGNHVSPDCKRNFCPDKLKKENPNFNTQAGEQTFVWVGRFKHILCSINKNHHLFYLYTEWCLEGIYILLNVIETVGNQFYLSLSLFSVIFFVKESCTCI